MLFFELKFPPLLWLLLLVYEYCTDVAAHSAQLKCTQCTRHLVTTPTTPYQPGGSMVASTLPLLLPASSSSSASSSWYPLTGLRGMAIIPGIIRGVIRYRYKVSEI